MKEFRFHPCPFCRVMSSAESALMVSISTPKPGDSMPFSQQLTPTSEDLAAAGRRISIPTVEEAVHVSSPELDRTEGPLTSSEQCELDCLREQLQQALDEKVELIEESLLDKERIKDQRETIELLTKRIREFEMMSRPVSSHVPNRSRSSNAQIKQLSEDNIQLAREVDRLIIERDRIEKKLIDLKIKFANGYLSRQNSASTDEDDNETNLFSTLSIDERLRRKRNKKTLGASSANKASVFSAARSWFARKGAKTPSKGKPNEVTVGIAV
jgi:hypothetical protein